MRKVCVLCVAVLVLASLPLLGQAAKSERTLVKMETSMGDMVIELFPDKARKTVENFLRYVDDGAYDNTIFHRVMDGFMIQGGGFKPDMTQVKTRAPIQNEAANGLKNERYSVAMARTGDPHSATNQFFINVVNNPPLNHKSPGGDGWGYAVFGRVVDGMDVVDKIKTTPTGNQGMHQNVPRKPVVIKKAYRFQLP
jgi:cyclophilin family peptidyl-prolyl cis-trans isomerase